MDHGFMLQAVKRHAMQHTAFRIRSPRAAVRIVAMLIVVFVCVVLRVGNGVTGGDTRRSGWLGHVHMHATKRKQHKSDQNESGQSTSQHLQRLLFLNAVHSECCAPGTGEVNSSWSFPGYSFRTKQHFDLPKAPGRKVRTAGTAASHSPDARRLRS